MERQAGLGRSLEDVLEAVPPIEPTDPARSHALFGIAPGANGTAATNGHADSKKKKKKSKKSDAKRSGDQKKKKTTTKQGKKSKKSKQRKQ